VEYLRSVLSTPGQRQRMIDKVYNGLDPEPDGVIFDLEDAVPPDLKDQAREMVAEVIRRKWRPGATARFVRVNGSPEQRLVADIRAVVHPGLDGLTLPKVERPEDVLFVDRLLSALEPDAGLPVGTIRLLISIESAKGLLRAYDILSSSPRILGVFLGAEDFSLDLGLPVVRSGGGQEALFARSTIVIAAAAARIFSIDQGSPNFHDLDALRALARSGRELGFTGSWCIHPSQVAIVHEAYSPQLEEVDLARRVVAAFDEAKAQGLGAVMMGGQFVEIPIVERAQRTLRLHEKLASRKRQPAAAGD
jgi:citrate lyase subunit beta/citryl-CoA lyase